MLKFIRFADLPVTDQDRAIEFYVDKLGLRVAQDAPYQNGWRWITLEIPGADTRMLLTRRSTDTESTEAAMVLVVDDVRRTYDELKDKGVVFTEAPAEAPWAPGELYALFRDSEENTIVLSSG